LKLTEHFTLDELTRSSVATRLGIDNTPTPEIVAHLTTLAMGLEQVRALLDVPIYIDSGYRCQQLNAAVGGATRSAHMEGYAADFIAPDFGTPLQITKAIATSDISFDKCIQEGNWVHISFAPAQRGLLFTAHFDALGKATYTAGV